jgi:hypothetical protein
MRATSAPIWSHGTAYEGHEFCQSKLPLKEIAKAGKIDDIDWPKSFLLGQSFHGCKQRTMALLRDMILFCLPKLPLMGFKNRRVKI